MNNRIISISLILISLLFSPSAIAIELTDWQSNIDRYCKITMTGRAKSILSERGVWFDTAVSMDVWAEDMRNDNPVEQCKTIFMAQKDQIKYQQCVAYIKDKWDWYHRCRSIVNQMALKK